MTFCSLSLFVPPHCFFHTNFNCSCDGRCRCTFLSSPELTVEIQFRGAVVWYPEAGLLIVHCHITFVTTSFSLLHFLVYHCRKHLYPSSSLHTVWFSFWVLNQHLSYQVLAVVSRGVFHSFPGTQCSGNAVNVFQQGQRSSKVQPMAIFIFNINKALGQEGMSYLPRPVASSLSKPAFWTKDDLVCFSTLFQVVCWLLLSHLLCSQQTLNSYLLHPLEIQSWCSLSGR